MEYKLVVSDFIKDELNSDDRYNSYRLTVPIKIFQYTLMDDDLEEFELYVSKKILLQDIIYKINEYINWLQNCEQELKKYYEKQLHETVNKNWFNELEIYNVSIIFVILVSSFWVLFGVGLCMNKYSLLKIHRINDSKYILVYKDKLMI